MRRRARWVGRWRWDLLALAAVVLLGGAFLVEMVLMEAVPVARDIQLFFLPHKHILWSSLQEMELPLWTPLVRTGYPVLANFQSGVFYPPHWLYAILPFLPAFNFLIVLHLLLGGVGAYLLARQLDFSPAEGVVGAIAFMLGGYFVSLTNLINAFQTAAWAPLMIVTLVRHAESRSGSTLVAAVSVYLMGFLAGAPQTFVLAASVALAVAVTRVSAGDGTPSPIKGGLRITGTLAFLAVAVAGLAAVQILPTLEMVRHSGRSGGLALAEAAQYSLSPVRLLHLVVPNDFSDPVYRFGEKTQLSSDDPWLFSVYVGIAALAVAWHARKDRARRGLVVLWGVLAVTGVVLALGRHTPVFPWLHGHVPVLSSFRYPEKFFVLTGIAVPMLAAHGSSVLLRSPRMDLWDGVAALGALCGALGAKLLWSLQPGRFHDWLAGVSPDAPALEHFAFAYAEWGQELDVVVAVLAATVGLMVAYRNGWLGRKPFFALLVVIMGLDLWVAHRALNPVVDPGFYRRTPAVADLLPMEELRTAHRYRATPFDERSGFYDYHLPRQTAKWYWQQTMQPATGALWGVMAHDASDAIHLDAVRMQARLFEELPREQRVRLLRLNSISHVYSALPEPELEASKIETMDSIPGVVHFLDDPLPRAYLAHGRHFRDQFDALNFALHPATDYRREVAILEGRGREGPGGSPHDAGIDTMARNAGSVAHEPAGPDDRKTPRGQRRSNGAAPPAGDPSASLSVPGEARIASDDGETVTIEVDPASSAYLVLTDTWYPGWRAWVDGEERPIHRANHFFRAVHVEPGDERVVFRYRSDPFRHGAMISMGSVVVLAGGLAGWAIRRRRRRSADADSDGDSDGEAP